MLPRAPILSIGPEFVEKRFMKCVWHGSVRVEVNIFIFRNP